MTMTMQARRTNFYPTKASESFLEMQAGDLEGLSFEECIKKVDEKVKSYCSQTRGIRLVSFSPDAKFGSPLGIDGLTCDCKAWYDNAQCKHVLAVAHFYGAVDLSGAERDKNNSDVGGRPHHRRPARVKQLHHSQRTTPARSPQRYGNMEKRQREEEAVIGESKVQRTANSQSTQELLTYGTPVYPRDSKLKSRVNRPKEAERGRAKQRKNKGKGSKKGN